ncbi:MAG: transcriptional regulator BetI [Pseudomonadota bacterium]
MATIDQTSAAARPRKERKENAARRRRQLIDATLSSIVENGLAGTTLATVARAAGLSQGVAVFYFQNKQTLLSAAMADKYAAYQACWEAARTRAGDDPARQLRAMVHADFDAAICDADSLVVWHAFWGEASVRPQYLEIAEAHDQARFKALIEVVTALFAQIGRPAEDAAEFVTTVEAISDGLWLRIHLATGAMARQEARKICTRFLATQIPERASVFLDARED